MNNESLPAASLRLRGRSDSRSSGVSRKRDKFLSNHSSPQQSCEVFWFNNKEYLPYNSLEAAEFYSKVYTGFWDEFPDYLLSDFVAEVKDVPDSKGLVLCIGSGLGNEAALLKSLGIKPICLDGAREMVYTSLKISPSVQGNFLYLPFYQKSFDGVWTYKTLNHSLNTKQLQKGFSEIKRVLKYKGALSICMLRGNNDERKSSFLDGVSTRENLFLTQETFQRTLEDNGFVIETLANIRRGHTDYMIANCVNLNKNEV